MALLGVWSAGCRSHPRHTFNVFCYQCLLAQRVLSLREAMSVLANYPATPCIISWPFSNNQICTAFAVVNTFEEFSNAFTEYTHVLNHVGFGLSSRGCELGQAAQPSRCGAWPSDCATHGYCLLRTATSACGRTGEEG
jgi:hypothetical protein